MEYNFSQNTFLEEKIAQLQTHSCKRTKVSCLTTKAEEEAGLSNESQKNRKGNGSNEIRTVS